MRNTINFDGPTRALHRCLAAAVVLASLFHAGCHAADDTTTAEITPIAGFLAPEDIDVLADGRALVTSGYSAAGNGDLRIFYPGTGRIDLVYAPSEKDRATANTAVWGAPSCPGPPPGFAAHGIHVSRNAAGTYTLLAVNHTGREAVEWFEIREAGESFTVEWRGCVLVHEPHWINDVAMLPDGGLVASHMMPRELASTAFEREAHDGIESGHVIEWQPEDGWRKVPGTDGALRNGIQVSPDGSVIYSNHYLSHQVVAIERKSGRRVWTAAVEGAPDNLSITSNGDLLAVTQLESLAAVGDCLTRPAQVCALGFAVHRLDASTGAAHKILNGGDGNFGGATVAVEVGDAIYLGAVAGEWMGRTTAR